LEKTFRTVKYTTLSPLHIGDGNTLGPMEYFVYDGKIHFYRSEDLNRVLTKDGREDFVNYAIYQQSPTLQGFFEKYGGKGVLSTASKNASYSLNFWGGETPTPSKVWAFIKSRNKPYIPGSEIKGAIRTAIVRKLIDDNSQKANIIRNEISGLKADKRKEENLSIHTLRIPQQKWDKTFWDAKFDFMKFLFVSDASAKEVKSFVAKVENKNTSKPGDFHEIAPEKTEFQGWIAISNKNQFQEFIKCYKADDQRKALFGNLEPIFTACYEMSKEVIEEEMKFYRRSYLSKIGFKRWELQQVELILSATIKQST
jgi:CRISPR-associated protein Csm5